MQKQQLAKVGMRLQVRKDVSFPHLNTTCSARAFCHADGSRLNKKDTCL